MAEAYGNKVWYWRTYLSVSVENISDTLTRVHVYEFFRVEGWAYQIGLSACVINMSSPAIGLNSPATFTGSAIWQQGGMPHTQNIQVFDRYLDLPRGDGAYDVAVYGEIRNTSGYHNGTSAASVTVTVPAIGYQVPNAPSDLRGFTSGNSATMQWQNNPSGTTKKYTGVAVEKSVDGGAWGTAANLAADATSWTDGGISRRHSYAYRVKARNNAGWSGASNTYSFIAYDTPPAPSGLSASRVSDTLARVAWANNPGGDVRPYTSVSVERSTDGGGYVGVATLPGGATNWADNGVTPGHYYAYRVKAGNGAGWSGPSGASTVYNTPPVPGGISLAKASATSVRVTVTGYANWAPCELQRRLNGGGWAAVGTYSAWPVIDNPGGGTARYRVRAVRDGLASAWCESEEIVAIVAPNAPALGQLATPYESGSTVTVAWTPNHPDGTAQTAAQVEVAIDGKATTHDIHGDTASLELTGLADGGYTVRVRTKGLHADWGAWSEYSAFTVAAFPIGNFTSPSMEGALVAAMPMHIKWAVADKTGVVLQQMELLDAAGNVMWSSYIDNALREQELGSYGFIANNAAYTLRFTVRGGSGLSATFTRAFHTNWLSPIKLDADVVYDEDLAAHITALGGKTGYSVDGTTLLGPILKGEGSLLLYGPVVGNGSTLELGEAEAPKSFDIARIMPDGTRRPVAIGVVPGDTRIDPIPPLNVDFEYEVIAYAESGATSTTTVDTLCDSGGMEAYNFSASAAIAHILGFNATASEGITRSGETFHFALGAGSPELPTFYPDGDMDVTGSKSYVIADKEQYRKLRETLRSLDGATCWYRSAYGATAFGHLSGTLSYDAKKYNQFDVSIDFTEGVWEDPINA